MKTFSSRLLLLTLLVSVLLCLTARSQTLPKREFRGAWISTVTNIDWPPSPLSSQQVQKDALVAILDKLAAQGFNAVVFQIRPECDALYQSSIEPWSYYVSGSQGVSPGYDPLAFAVEEAHKRGLEIHAWFNPYRAVRSIGAYPLSPSHVSITHPEWILTIGSAKILDPGMAAVRQYVLSVIADVVRRYDVDAVHMDDYFYVEGITNQDANTYSTESRGFTNLGDWRRDNVNLLIRAINDTVHAIKPWMKFGMSPRGIWKNGVPPGIVGADNYNTIYCDAVAWLQGQYIDYLAPQLYWKFGGGQDYALLEPWWASQKNGRHLYPGLATYRIGQSTFGTASMIAQQIRFNRTGNAEGSIQFTANQLTSNLGGIADSLRNDLFRYPALLPVMRWKDTLAPYPPRGIMYATTGANGRASIQWEKPLTAPDGDSASRYAIYRFDHYPVLRSELDDTKNLVAVSGQRMYFPPAPSEGQQGAYYLVTALDRNYNESDTSFVLHIVPPGAPALVSPLNGAVVPDSMLCVWRNPGLASGYLLEVSTDSSFSAGTLIDSVALADTAFMVHGLKGESKYFWRVRALNAGGYGPYSTGNSIVTNFPAAITLENPANMTADVPLVVQLRWHPSSLAASYRVQLSTTLDFTTTVMDTTVTDTSAATPTLQSYRLYFWRARAIGATGTGDWSTTFKFRTISVSGIEEQQGVPSEYGLGQNYPNPFNPTTTIAYQVGGSREQGLNARNVTLVVYDLLGREVATLVNEQQAPGYYAVRFDAGKLATGTYIYRLQAGSFVMTRKMLYVK